MKCTAVWVEDVETDLTCHASPVVPPSSPAPSQFGWTPKTDRPRYTILTNRICGLPYQPFPPLLAASPAAPSQFGWNLKTDDLSLEYNLRGVKLLALKRPAVAVPTLALSVERDFEF